MTFGKKLAIGFAITVTFTIVMAVIAVYALNRVVASKDRVIAVNAQNLTDAAKLQTAVARKAAAVRGVLAFGRSDVSRGAARARQIFFNTPGPDEAARVHARREGDAGRMFKTLRPSIRC